MGKAYSVEMASVSRLCVVVGVGPGIGGAVARKFAKEGWNVAVVARTQETVDQHVADLNQLNCLLGNTARGYCYDASADQEVHGGLRQIRSDFGTSIHTLIYNAGAGMFKGFDETSAEDFDRCFRVNAHGLFVHAKEVADEMRNNSSGVIGITGATASLRGMPATPAFAPSK